MLACMRVVVWQRKQRQPALDDRFVVSGADVRWIHVHHDVQVIAHDDMGEHIGREAEGDKGDSGLYPLLSVLERLTGVVIDTAQK